MDNTQTKNLTNTQNPNDSVSVGKSSTPPINTVGLRTTPVSTMQVMMTQEMDEVKEFVDNANVYTSISQITIENQYLIIYFTNGLTFNCGRVKGTDGKTPVIEIGTITTLDPGKQATGDIVHIGETEDGSPLYRLDLSIPKGDKGDAGDSASGNVQVTTGNLLSGRQYAFVPSENGSANGSFVEIVTNEAPSDGNAYGQKNKAWVKVVEHEDGKGLSTNDLTNELLDRINNLVNYDDTTIKAEIENIKKQLDTLFGEGVSDAIDTFNEIEEFLAGISDSQSLNDILNSLSENIIKLIPTKLSDLQNDANYVSDAYYVHTDNNFSTLEKAKLEGLENYDDSAIRGEINNVKSNLDQKQDKLVSGTSIKTVNGQSILGEGNISIEAPEQRQADWNETNPESTAFIKNKPTIPNIDVDKAYVDSQISGVNAAISEANGKIDGKVDKVDGKQLSTNDYTTEDKNKLDGIEDGANNYKLPNATNLVLGGVKIGDNISGNSGVISLTKQNVISALGFDPSQSDMMLDVTDFIGRISFESTISDEDLALLNEYYNSSKVWYKVRSNAIIIINHTDYNNGVIKIYYNDYNSFSNEYMLVIHSVNKNSKKLSYEVNTLPIRSDVSKIPLYGYQKLSQYTSITSSDSIIQAIGKLEAGIGECDDIVDITDIINKVSSESGVIAQEDYDLLRSYMEAGKLLYMHLPDAIGSMPVKYSYGSSNMVLTFLTRYLYTLVYIDIVIDSDLSYSQQQVYFPSSDIIADTVSLKEYTKPSLNTPITENDSIKSAIGKLEAGVMEALHTQPNPKWVAFCEVVNKILNEVFSGSETSFTITVSQEDINTLKAPLIGKTGFQDFTSYMAFNPIEDLPAKNAFALYLEENNTIGIYCEPYYSIYNYSFEIGVDIVKMEAVVVMNVNYIVEENGNINIVTSQADSSSNNVSGSSITLKTSGDGTKALMDNGKYMEVGAGSGGGIPEAPADGKVYGRDGSRKSWVEVANGDDVVVLGSTMPLPNNGGTIDVTAEQFEKIKNAAKSNCDIVLVLACSVVRCKAIEWVGNYIGEEDYNNFPFISVYFEVPLYADVSTEVKPSLNIRVDINTQAKEDGSHEGICRYINSYPILENIDLSLATEEGVDITSSVSFNDNLIYHIQYAGKLAVDTKTGTSSYGTWTRVIFNLLTDNNSTGSTAHMVLRSEQPNHQHEYHSINDAYEILINENKITLYKLPASGGSNAPEPYYLSNDIFNLRSGATDEEIKSALGGDSGISKIREAIKSKRPIYMYSSIYGLIPVNGQLNVGVYLDLQFLYDSIISGQTIHIIKYKPTDSKYICKIIYSEGYTLKPEFYALNANSTSDDISTAVGGNEGLNNILLAIQDGNRLVVRGIMDDITINADLTVNLYTYDESTGDITIALSCFGYMAFGSYTGNIMVLNYQSSSNTFECNFLPLSQ